MMLKLKAVTLFCHQVPTQAAIITHGFRLSGAEREKLGHMNRIFEKPLRCELEVRELFIYDMPHENWNYYTSAEISKRLMPIPPAENVGRVLAKLAREDERILSRRVGKGVQYLIPLTPTCTPPM